MYNDIRDDWKFQSIERDINSLKNQVYQFANKDEVHRISMEIGNLNRELPSINMFNLLKEVVDSSLERIDNLEQKVDDLTELVLTLTKTHLENEVGKVLINESQLPSWFEKGFRSH